MMDNFFINSQQGDKWCNNVKQATCHSRVLYWYLKQLADNGFGNDHFWMNFL